MLQRLEIEDFGLIARASLDFAAGLTVCTGETGSGKTMLLGALAFVLGERSSADLVRAGASRARVTLAVEADAALRERLDADGFELDPGEPALLARELQPGGKSAARINGRPATAAQLRELGGSLVDLVGQHEQQRLLSQAYQLDLLDRFAGAPALAARSALASAYARVAALESELRELETWLERGLAEIEFARFAFAELESLAPEPGEDDALRERRDYLANVERIAGAVAQAHAALAEGDASALEALGAAAAALSGVARYDAELTRVAERLAALQNDAAEAALALSREADRAEFDPAELERVTERLDALERVKKKYGGSSDALVQARARFAAILERDATRDERGTELATQLVAARRERDARATELSALRAAAAGDLERRVAAELKGLAIPAARFGVSLEALETVGPHGAERIEFALSPNPGEPARPLARAASGGELSRVLLALVVVLADRRERTALVFDEIDAGIGGATAAAVGERLNDLARGTQVVCVTHLAQLAAFGDRHYALRKRDARGATTIEIGELADRRTIVEEVARMLSGSTAGVALEHAASLLADAGRRKAEPKLSA
jgi:DNA repair protein RecN (Recombination protein N)